MMRRCANPPDHRRHVLVQYVRAFGIEISDAAWAALNDDQLTP